MSSAETPASRNIWGCPVTGSKEEEREAVPDGEKEGRGGHGEEKTVEEKREG